MPPVCHIHHRQGVSLIVLCTAGYQASQVEALVTPGPALPPADLVTLISFCSSGWKLAVSRSSVNLTRGHSAGKQCMLGENVRLLMSYMTLPSDMRGHPTR